MKKDAEQKSRDKLGETGMENRGMDQVVSVIQQGSSERAADCANRAKEYRQMARVYSQCSRTAEVEVLIVEDNSSVGKMIRKILEDAGVVCYVAATADEALTFCHTNVPSVVLMDIELPDADGLVLTRALKATSSMKNTPIIAITAHVDSGTMMRAMEVGCDNFIGKPFTKEYLLRTVRRQLDEI